MLIYVSLRRVFDPAPGPAAFHVPRCIAPPSTSFWFPPPIPSTSCCRPFFSTRPRSCCRKSRWTGHGLRTRYMPARQGNHVSHLQLGIRAPRAPGLANGWQSALLFATLFGIPMLAYLAVLYAAGLPPYNYEVTVCRQFVWMIDCLREGNIAKFPCWLAGMGIQLRRSGGGLGSSPGHARCAGISADLRTLPPRPQFPEASRRVRGLRGRLSGFWDRFLFPRLDVCSLSLR